MSQLLVVGALRRRAPAGARRRADVAESRLAYDRRRRMNERSAETVLYMRQVRSDPCAWCMAPAQRVQDVDHIVPLLAGGEDRWENMTASCLRCNRGRKAEPLLRTLVRQRA